METAYKLFVSNIHYHVTEEELDQVFRSAGVDVRNVHIGTDRATGQSRGFAFIAVASGSDIGLAVNRLYGTDLRGRAINVQRARERDEWPAQRFRDKNGRTRIRSTKASDFRL